MNLSRTTFKTIHGLSLAFIHSLDILEEYSDKGSIYGDAAEEHFVKLLTNAQLVVEGHAATSQSTLKHVILPHSPDIQEVEAAWTKYPLHNLREPIIPGRVCRLPPLPLQEAEPIQAPKEENCKKNTLEESKEEEPPTAGFKRRFKAWM
jgi:hypothetical protein